MKIHLYNQSMDRQSRIEELSLDVENSVKAFDVSYFCIFVLVHINYLYWFSCSMLF